MTFAIIGDVEPKPVPEFDHLESAVEVINRIDDETPLDFVAGIGDIPHRGKRSQYLTVTPILRRLEPPFYPILGNEELTARSDAVGRFLKYATRWNDEGASVPDIKYSKEYDDTLFVFASASGNGKDFEEKELDWIESRVTDHPSSNAVLFVHAPPKSIFPEPDGKEMGSENFERILQLPTVTAVFSGHSHTNLDSAPTHVEDEWGTHHFHVPGIERTKFGDRHVPRIRFVRIGSDGDIEVHTYNLLSGEFEREHGVTIDVD